jgi:N-acetylglutamate synthase-like GNAT family acetyltransferase
VSIQYRNATPNDIPDIQQLLEGVRGDDRDMTPDEFIVAHMDDKIVGCARIKMLETGEPELASVAVVAGMRGRGIGSELVNSIARRERHRPIYLLCLEEAGAFYLKLGFRIASPKELPAELKQEYERIQANLALIKKSIFAMALE